MNVYKYKMSTSSIDFYVGASCVESAILVIKSKWSERAKIESISLFIHIDI